VATCLTYLLTCIVFLPELYFPCINCQVLEGRPQYVEMTGNLVAVSKSGEQPYIEFNSFYENRLPLVVRVRDPHQDPTGRVAFFREPRTSRSDLPQPPTCSLNLRLPSIDDSAPGAGKIRDDDEETESRSHIIFLKLLSVFDNMCFCFSRSCRTAACSMIVFNWHHTVVCLSVCLSVTNCIVAK